MNTSELCYPVIMFDEEGYITVYTDEDMFTTMPSYFLKHNLYGNCNFVDCTSRAFKVKDTRFVSGKGKFWGYRLSLIRIVRVALTLDDPVSISLEEVKKKVLLDMKRGLRSTGDPHWWLGEMRKVKQAQSVREIADIIQPEYDIKLYFKLFDSSS